MKQIRITVQAALCLCLSPLLVAQQAMEQPQQPLPANRAGTPVPVKIKIPAGTAITVGALEAKSSATAHVGDTVPFVVADDVFVNGIRIIAAGTKLTGKVVKVRKGKPRHYNGEIKVKLDELKLGNGIKLRLTDKNPKKTRAIGEKESPPLPLRILRDIALLPVGAVIIAGMVALSPVILLLVIDDAKYGDEGILGIDTGIARCTVRTVYVAGSPSIRSGQLPMAVGNPAPPAGCWQTAM